MRRFFEKLFGRSRSDREVIPDVEQPSTSQQASETSTILDEGPPPPVGLGDVGETPEPKAAPASETRKSRKRWTTSSVIQSSVVEAGHSAIPSVTLMLLGHNTADRITRVMDKLDSLGLDSPEPRRKTD